jgi:hypothetical protein
MNRRAVHQQEVRLRRELNSHDAAEPRTASQAQCRTSVARATNADGQRDPRAPTRLSESQCTVQHETFSPAGPNAWTPCATSPRRALLETTGLQSVGRPTEARVGAHGPGQASRRLKCVPRHRLRRGAGSTCSMPPETTGTSAGWPQCSLGAALPNPSLERRPREACHPWAAQASRRLHYPARPKGSTPHGSPQLER